MDKYLRVADGNYRVVVKSGGRITLDTGTEVGDVYITGNLTVEGTQTTLDTVNSTIEDNIIELNKGETGNGITRDGSSGIRVDRGTIEDGQWLFVESINWTDTQNSGTTDLGAWSVRSPSGRVGGIETVSIVTPGVDLNLMGQYNLSGNVTPNPGMLTVKGTASYEARVLDDDHIPNKKYVDDTVSNFFGTVVPNRIQVGDTKVHVYDNSVSGPSRIETEIDGTLIQDVRPNYSDQYGIRIEQTLYGTEIKTLGTSQEDLILSATGTGHVVVDDNLRLGYTPHEGVDGVTDPVEPSDGILFYAKPSQAAGTGMYFVNAESQRDEIISKNRALIFSMLF
ncbi:hypothetical protein N9C48_00160 [bacterium]|nr:hypothetical protein [bacterium]